MTMPNELYELTSALRGDVDMLMKQKHHRLHGRPIEDFTSFIAGLEADIRVLKLSHSHPSEVFAGVCPMEVQGRLPFPRPFRKRPAVILSSLCYSFDEHHPDHKHYVECQPFLTAADKTAFSYSIYTNKLAQPRQYGWQAVNELHYICMTA